MMTAILKVVKKILPFYLFAFLPMTASAQSDDFGLDFTLDDQKTLSRKRSLVLE